MAKLSDFVIYLLEQLSGCGEVSAKSMFGGYGIYHGGLMFGLVADDMVYLKVDAESEPEFVELKLEPFRYEKNGKQMKMSYYQPPASAMDSAPELCEWARKADAAAKRADAKKGNKKRAK
ncbi:MAG: DNA transformation protein [Limisphaerales bacterium]|jgi:DNA transformation protein